MMSEDGMTSNGHSLTSHYGGHWPHVTIERLKCGLPGRGKIYTELEDLLQTVNDLLHTFTVIT